MFRATLIVVLACTVLAVTARAQQPILTGTVKDETGGILQSAMVEVIGPAGTVIATVQTDAQGNYQVASLPPATYTVRVSYESFKSTTARVRVGTRPVTQHMVLPLASLTESVHVGTGETTVSTSNAANQDAVTLDQDLLSSLPVFDRDIVATASRFLDASAIGNGGVTVVVNGMEVNSLTLPASAVQQIKINQDPYSAEYSRPGRGRIEILTKPGGQTYSGETNLTLRDGHLNARNAFATTPPRDRRHIVDGTMSGPVRDGRHASFMLSGQDDTDDQQAVVFAVTPSGIVHDVSPQPNSHALLTGSLTLQHGTNTTIAIRPAYQYESSLQRGVGGVTLASAGSNFRHHEQSVTYTQQSIVKPTLVHQFQILGGHEREPTSSTSPARGLVVAGAFTGGGAQADLVRTERHIQLTDSLAWTRPHHLLQAGVQLPDWSWRGFEDRTNVGGTYYFSSLDAYVAGQPDTFVQQSGNGTLLLLEKQVGLYLKDDWQIRDGLAFSAGARYDWQNYFHDTNNLAPRLSLSYKPSRTRGDVFRVGAGIFNDRSGPVVIADIIHAQPGGLTRYVVEHPSYPDPFVTGIPQARSIVQLAPDVRIPQSLQYSASWDHQLSKTATATVTYTGTRGYGLFRSRDVNAPPPPFFSTRPDPTYSVIRQVESTGRQQSQSLQFSVRGRMRQWLNGQAQYTWGRAMNDTGGINAFPANDYDLSGEWARADNDRRHRVVTVGRVRAGHLLDIGTTVTLQSGAPYSETLGADIYANGRGRARPAGVARNTLQGPGYADVDVRLSRALALDPQHKDRKLAFNLDVFNVFNRVNYTTVVGTLGSPLFGQPVAAREPRQLQASLQMSF